MKGNKIDEGSTSRVEVLEEELAGQFTSTLVIKQIRQQDFGTYEVRSVFSIEDIP